MQGCASGISTTLPLAIVRDRLAGSAARQRLSEVTTINNFMPILAPILGSLVMLLGRWRILFATQALFAGCIICALLFGFRESLPLERRHRLHPSVVISNYASLLTNRVFLGYALINGLAFACIFSFLSVSPLILMQHMGVTRSAYPFLFGVIAIGSILGSFTSAIFNRRHAPVRSLVTAGLLTMTVASICAVALQIAGFHRLVFILPPVFATLFGFGLIVPSVTLGALEPVPNLSGSGSGALRSILMIFGSAASGFLATYCGRHPSRAEVATTLTMSGTALAALLVYRSLVRTTTPNDRIAMKLQS
jgi:DHA1 family bicyclomycin/chloramphenicol resistance-like MFS transporter